MDQSIQGAGIAFRLQRRFEAPREAVFAAWTKSEALRQWWCPEGWSPADIEIDLRVGGAFRIGMRRSSGGEPVYVCGHFLEVRPPERLIYTWRWENAFEGMPETRVTVHFADRGAATDLLLIHENLPEIPICLQHRSGWITAWNRLERTLSRGTTVDGVRAS